MTRGASDLENPTSLDDQVDRIRDMSSPSHSLRLFDLSQPRAFLQWGGLLHWLGIRRHVLWIDNCNWAEVDWRKVFESHPSLRRLYRLKSIKLVDIMKCAPERRCAEVNCETYKDQYVQGLNLWELSKTGILASLEVPCLPKTLDDRTFKVIRHYYSEATKIIEGACIVLTRARPDAIILSQGCTAMSRPIVEVARTLHINVVAVEGSFLRDYIFVDNATGMIVNRHGCSRLAGDWLPAQEFTPEKREAFRRQFSVEQEKKRPEHETGDEVSVDLRRQLGIPAERQIALFVGQVLTDSSQIMDSPLFPDPVELIASLAEIFARRLPDWCLIIRLHPKEIDGVSWANDAATGIHAPPGEPPGPLAYRDATWRRMRQRGLQEVPGKFIVIGDKSISTHDLMEQAAIGITVNSQAGLEMALTYKPMVVCGDAFYARKGFTWDVGHASALEAVLCDVVKHPVLTEAQKCAVDQLGHYLLKEFLFPRTLQGKWRRFFRVIDAGVSSPVRDRYLDKVTHELDRNVRSFGSVKNYSVMCAEKR